MKIRHPESGSGCPIFHQKSSSYFFALLSVPLNPAFLSRAAIFLNDLSLMFLLTVIVMPAVLMPLKAFVLILIAFVLLRRMFVSLPAPVNAFALSFVMEPGRETLVIFVHFANAFDPIDVTLYLMPSSFA